MSTKGFKKEDVLHLANLSKLSLTDEEIDLYTKQLGDILSYIEQLQEVNTDGVEATFALSGMENITAEDKESPSPTDVLENTYAKKSDNKKYFKVGKVL